MAKYQRAYFPMEVLTLTQGYGSTSSTHVYSYALDLAGKDAGRDNIYAPFDCKVTKLYVKAGHAYTVWLTSTTKVLCANGVYDYLTMAITHPSEIAKMKVGQTFKQGTKILTEGNTGVSSGYHCHLELSLGTKAGWQIINKHYVNVNKVKPEEYLFAYDNATIKKNVYKNKTYKFKKEKDMYMSVNSKDGLNIHKTPDFKKSSIIGTLKNGQGVTVFKKTGSMSLVYSYGLLGYVSSKYLK